MDTNYELTSRCFLLDADDEEYGDPRCIAYFPLKSLLLRVNPVARALLERLREGPLEAPDEDQSTFLEQLIRVGVINGKPEQTPDKPLKTEPLPCRTMLLTSDRCPLRCVYCYGQADNSGEQMTTEVARAAVDFLVVNAAKRRQRGIDVSFHGGGEPTTNWAVLTDVISYAERRAAEEGLALSSSICTNGILSDAQVSWLAAHIRNVIISFDGPPDVQNAQRPLAGGGPSYDRVARVVDHFRSLEKPLVFRMTATSRSEGRLAEHYRFLVDRFAPRTVCIEPLFVCGRCETSLATPPRAHLFTRDLIDTFTTAKETGVPVMYSGGRLSYLSDRFCGAAGENFFVTPGGEVTSCVEVSHGGDPRTDIFFYGQYDFRQRRFTFNLERYRKIQELNVDAFAECDDCFARFHCAGDCPAKAREIENRRNPYRCEINRAIIGDQLYALALHCTNEQQSEGG